MDESKRGGIELEFGILRESERASERAFLERNEMWRLKG